MIGKFAFIELKTFKAVFSCKLPPSIKIISGKGLLFILRILFKDFFYFHKRTNYENYLKILDKADIFLDNIGFSGFNTGMEAINLNKPIVTMSNNFLRGRLVYSILKKISMNALIANTKEEYVRIVIKLVTNSAFKKSIIKDINKNKKKLFNDKNYITILENFFYSIKK